MLYVPLRFVAITRSNSSSFIFMMRLSLVTPALFTRISTLPNASAACLKRFSQSSGTVTFAANAAALTPCSSISLTVSSAASFIAISQITTFAPSDASFTLIALPIPRAPPVTIAVFPSKFLLISTSCYDVRMLTNHFK